MEQAVAALARQTAVQDVFDEGGEALAVRLALARQAPDHARQADGRPAVAHAPKGRVLELVFAVVPDVREKLLVRIPEELLVAVDLGHGLVVVAHCRQKRRGAVEAVGPHFGRAKHMVEDALGAARRLIANPVQQALDGFVDLRIPGPLGGARVGFAAHGGVGWSAADYHAQTSIRRALDDRRLGQQNDGIAVARFQRCLGQDSLLPIATLHGHRRRHRLLNPPFGLRHRGRRPARGLGDRPGNAERCRSRQKMPPVHRTSSEETR